MTECYACSKLAELRAENNALHVKLDGQECADVSQAVEDTAERVTNQGEMLHDTCEKLEADALVLVDNLRMYGGKYAGDAEVEIIGMLDRQAAITERHILTHPDERDEQIAELQREVDRLTRQNISLARDLGECMAERDGLKRENAKLSDDEFYLRCTLVDMDGEVVG